MTLDFSNQDPYIKRVELAVLGDNPVTIADVSGGGTIGTAATTVDVATSLNIHQLTPGQTLTIPSLTATGVDKTLPLNNVGSTNFTVLGTVLAPGAGILLNWTGSTWSVIGTSSGATGVTLNAGATLSVNGQITLTGTNGQTYTYPSASATLARIDAANTFTGVQTFSSTPVFSSHLTVEGVTSNGATGTGSIVFATSPTLTTPVIGVATGTSLAVTGLLKSSGTAGIGYATGAGGTITQITSRTTGVTLSKTSGQITLFSAAGSATPASFTVTNTLVAATDVVIVSQVSGTDAYSAFVTAVGAGSYKLTITDLTGTTTEQPVFNVVVIKGVSA